MAVKINKLEIENVKRVKAVKIEPTANGLTVIGGNNNQGKTSVLDAIAWALGGNKFKPSQPNREGSVIPPNLKLTLSNGLIVERKGKNSDLKITDPLGNKAGQQLLDSFVDELALNLPKFMESTNKDKGKILLQIIGVGDKLIELEQKESQLYNERLTIGRIADQKEKFAKEQISYDDAPKDLVSASDLIQQQQTILAKNGENQRKREKSEQIKQAHEHVVSEVQRLQTFLSEAMAKEQQLASDLAISQKDALALRDESTEELERNIQEIEEINRKVRANLDKDKAEDDAKEYKRQYNLLTETIESLRQDKMALLNNADLPLDGLSVADGELIYLGQKWDNMSGSQQLRVATAIVRKLKPDCGFVLLDKLEQMDLVTLNEFGKWLESEGLQAIATRVSNGEECQIIIEDGYSIENVAQPAPQPTTVPSWQNGQF